MNDHVIIVGAGRAHSLVVALLAAQGIPVREARPPKKSDGPTMLIVDDPMRPARDEFMLTDCSGHGYDKVIEEEKPTCSPKDFGMRRRRR